MSAKSSALTNKVLAAILACAKDLGKSTAQVTLSNLMAKDYGITEWDIRKLGGIDLVKKSNFPFEESELGEINKSKKERTYIAKLERAVGEKIAYEEMLSDHFAKLEFPKLSPKPKLPVKSIKPRHVVVSLNDVHYGLIVDPKEIGGVNKYGWTEASRRTALLAQQVAEYKIAHRSEVDTLHVILNGDMLQGIIHDLTARNSDLLALQQNGAIHILGNFIDYVRRHYKKVRVYGVKGNHDDPLHRREGGHRVSTHIYDSYITPVYFALSAMFYADPNVEFVLEKGLYVNVDLPAGRLLVTHGDVLFSKQLGNNGTAINVKNLSDVINRFNAGEMNMGHDKVRMILFGHTHNFAHFHTFDGVEILIAPSMSGVDNFAASLAINHNNVGQIIFESTDDYLIGDKRLVRLTDADNDTSMDKIIPIYDRGLSWRKR